MKLGEIISELGLDGYVVVLTLEWESSQQTMPAGSLFFLEPEFVRDACDALDLPREVAARAAVVARRVSGNEALKSLIWHCHHCLFRCRPVGAGVWPPPEGSRRTYPKYHADGWPSLEHALGDDAGMFYLLVLLSGVPQMKSVHRSHRVPEEVIRDNSREIRARLDDCSSELGTTGLDGHGVRWLVNFVRGELYVVGRLEYQFASFAERMRVYRCGVRGHAVALAEDGLVYRADGQLQKEGDSDPGTWTTRFEITPQAVTGNPILPTGLAARERICLKTTETREILRPGVPILAVHIPGGSPLDHEACGESLRRAVEFFSRHFPDRHFKAFQCSSWILDAQLEELLPPESNLVRFQRELYLYPVCIEDDAIVKAVFGHVPTDVDRAPRDTRLQRAIVERLRNGKRLIARAGGGFLLPEDVPYWGNQVYRRSGLLRELIDMGSSGRIFSGTSSRE